MNLLLVIDSLISGGAQRQMALLAGGLAKRGHAVDLFLYYPQYDYFLPEVESAGVRIFRGSKQHRFDLGPVCDIARLLKRSHYDAATAFLTTPSHYLLAAGLLSGTQRLIVSERLSARQQELSRLEHLRTLPYVMADLIVSNSHLYAHQLSRARPALARKIVVISNAVPAPFFNIPPRSTDSRIRLLSLGRVGLQKNPQTLVMALALLRRAGVALPDIDWAGRRETSRSDIEYIATVEKIIHAEGLTPRWHWLGERKDIEQLLGSCDAVLLSSFFEGTPNAVCEALASGRPVIASAVGDVPRLVEEGRTGFLFDPNSAHSLMEALEKFLMLSAAERARMSENARDFAREHLSAERYISQWEAALYGKYFFTSTSREAAC